MSLVEVYQPAPADREAASPRRIYERLLARAGSHRGVVLQLRAEELARHVRLAALCRPDTAAPGSAATAWLEAHLGQSDEPLKRTAVAALALGLEQRVAERFPAEFSDLYPLAHSRLASLLARERPYAPELFSKDMALVCALAAPAGALNVHTPEVYGPEGLPLRARKAATAFTRHVLQFGAEEARRWLRTAGARPWAELHLDVRALDAFNAEGFRRSYHLVAALMRARPDLAGLYGASWLYDPALAAISPGLAFVRRTAEDGGARIVRLKVDPVQTAFAVARSPGRRALVDAGAYRPACYAMYWPAADLISWSERVTAAHARGSSTLQVVRK